MTSPWDSFPSPREALRWGVVGAVFAIAIMGFFAFGATASPDAPATPVQLAAP
ncbi:MAG: hypothetical protein ACIARR_02830 [Phycisphaerales bacterium JB059]